MGHSRRTESYAVAVAALPLLLVAMAQPVLAQKDEPDGAAVDISGFIGIVEIREGDMLGYDLDLGGNLVPAPAITATGKILKVTAEPAEIRNCRVSDERIRLQLKGGGYHEITSFPKLEVTVPANSDLQIGMNSGQLIMGDARNLDLEFSGCGKAGFGSVTQALNVSVTGSGDVEGRSAGEVRLEIRGSGDFGIGDVSGPVSVRIDGSGDAGFGDIAGALSVSINGSGDIEADKVRDEVSIRLRGSGDVSVAGGTAKNVSAEVYGSGDVQFNGTADDVSVLLKGSGDVYVARLTGKQVVERHGSGDVRIGSWHSDDHD